MVDIQPRVHYKVRLLHDVVHSARGGVAMCLVSRERFQRTGKWRVMHGVAICGKVARLATSSTTCFTRSGSLGHPAVQLLVADAAVVVRVNRCHQSLQLVSAPRVSPIGPATTGGLLLQRTWIGVIPTSSLWKAARSSSREMVPLLSLSACTASDEQAPPTPAGLNAPHRTGPRGH